MKKDNLHNIKTTGFKIPEHYFETFDKNLSKKLNQFQDTKVISIWSWKNIAYATGIAASIVVTISVLFDTKSTTSFDDLETTSIENYLAEEELNTFDFASFLNEDDLVLDNFVSEKISETSIENYLLNNASIEDLIIDNK